MKLVQIFSSTTFAVLLISIIKTEANPTRRTCYHDSHCSLILSCYHGICRDPCTPDRKNQFCTVNNHVAVYTCNPGFEYPRGSDNTICTPVDHSCYFQDGYYMCNYQKCWDKFKSWPYDKCRSITVNEIFSATGAKLEWI